MKAEDLVLNKIYKNTIHQDNDDSINYEHIITIPTSALGTLRKELIETIGQERTKGFLLRYGWHCGVTDALKMKQIKWVDEKESLLAGPKMHILHGFLEEVNTVVLEADFIKGTLHWEAFWKNPYEAREYVKLFGHSEQPVCYTLVGYASGYLSTIMGKKVIVQETQCMGMGHEHCYCVCRTVTEWNGDADTELKYYEADSIINELEKTLSKLKKERDNLNRAYAVHEKLMKEVLRENDLSSIAKVLNQATKLPVLIEDTNNNLIAIAGMSKEEAKAKKIANTKGYNRTEYLSLGNNYKKMITPIYLDRKAFGYCSFIYHDKTPQEVDKMILERAALACSLYLLNERTRFSTEQRIQGSFLEDMLSNRMDTEDIIKRAHYLGFELNPPYFIITVNKTTHHLSIKEEIELNDELINNISNFLNINKVNSLLGQKSGNIIILLSEDPLSRNYKENICKNLLNYCDKKYTTIMFKMGVSSNTYSIEELAQLYEQSLISVKTANRNRRIVFFDTLGIAGILLLEKNSNIIKKFIHKKLGKLIESDKNLELTKTLYHYLNNGCNVHKTARVMNFSISGLRYRLERLKEILHEDINESDVAHEFYVALRYLIFLGELELDIDELDKE